jgi:glycosyltransferase involved in cell wall biosynthesis
VILGPVLIVDPGCFTPSYDRDLALGLGRLGWEVEIVTSEYEFEPLPPDARVTTRLLFPAELVRGGRAGRKRGSRWRRRFERAAGLLLGLLRLDRELRRRPPGIVHVQWSHLPWLDRFFWRRWRKSGWRMIYTAHDARPLVGTTPGIFAYGTRRLAASADAVVVHSESARAEMIGTGLSTDRVHSIPLASIHEVESPREIDSTPDRLAAKLTLGIDPQSPVVLFFGFVKPYKGLEVLLASLPRLLAARRDAKLVVAGEVFGSRPSYERLTARLGVADAIRWRSGFVASADVPTLFAAADVVALPYVAASSSAVLLTAYGFRRPVVATAIGGLVELVDDGVTGVLVPPRDPVALADALAGVLADPDRAEEMGNRGHARLISHHGWNAHALRLDALYRGFATRAPP